MNKILETERLIIREFELADADFILRLLNSPNWLKFIGDKDVKKIFDAKTYIQKNLINSYKSNNYGLWLVMKKEANIPIGMCGIVNREKLNHPDIGFAFLPEYENLGYGLESATAVINYAKYNLNIKTILAITDVNNKASIKLLNKIGLRFKESKELSVKDRVLVFTSEENKTDKEKLDDLTQEFFNVFTNLNNKVPDLESLKELLVSEAKIISNTKEIPEIYSIEEFILPRKKMLINGDLKDFIEYEVLSQTEIYGNIASRFSLYNKKGKFNGKVFNTVGQKSFQFIKINNVWKIASVVWCDEL